MHPIKVPKGRHVVAMGVNPWNLVSTRCGSPAGAKGRESWCRLSCESESGAASDGFHVVPSGLYGGVWFTFHGFAPMATTCHRFAVREDKLVCIDVKATDEPNGAEPNGSFFVNNAGGVLVNLTYRDLLQSTSNSRQYRVRQSSDSSAGLESGCSSPKIHFSFCWVSVCLSPLAFSSTR
jgi:hypothetical protein